MSYSAAPRVDPRQLRPGRGWYVIGVVIALILIIGGPVGAVLLAGSIVPELEARFATGTATTVQLTADKRWAIYQATADTETAVVPAKCNAEVLDGGTVSLTNPFGYNFSFGQGGRTWKLFIQMTVSQDGRVRVVCEPSPSGGQQEYAVAQDPQFGGAFGKIAGGIGVLVGLPCLGLLVGGLIILVVALRRRSYRKALQQQMVGYPPPGYPPPGAPPPGYWPPR